MKYWILLLLFLVNGSPVLEQEAHLKDVSQLTFGGENAEAYFSSDGKQLIFQSTLNHECDQIYKMNIDGSDKRLVSTGKGRTTCAYFFPGNQRILYSSTHEVSEKCPEPPDRSKGYVWGLYPYDIYSAKADGTDLKRLTNWKGYDAEATISPDGKMIVFTSDRDGDLELYSMDAQGSNVRRITSRPGYDGGAFFSTDSKSIVFRGQILENETQLNDFRTLLVAGLVRPTRLELFIADKDGRNIQQVTNNSAANFCPFFHPDGKRIVFASNMKDPKGRDFDLFLIRTDGTGLEQITFNPTFDAFPMFSPDGKHLVFGSNRNAKTPGETNVFIADWTD